ncbi:hypothetical protein [Streptomyces sp. NPDC047024]|uniref:hypothetical protein n=1 Tax=Streptomyces sp. NPDC047024 TaxID=3155476 RepID=UPI0033D74970
MSLQPKGLREVPAQTVAVAQAAFFRGTLAMWARDWLGEVFAEEPFAEAFGRLGVPGLSPAVPASTTNAQPEPRRVQLRLRASGILGCN